MVRSRRARGRALGAVAAVLVVCAPLAAHAQGGEQKFQQVCAACHSIGQGVRIGPDLKGVAQRHTQDWLVRFVSSPSKMIASGDAAAIALQKQFPIVMPDLSLSQADVQAILAYVEQAGGSGAPTAPQAPAAPARVPTAAEIRLGQDLFQGHVRFANGGPTCNSCHDVRNDAVIGGGRLAVELTAVFGRIGATGIQAILGSPPFPVMQAAYRDRALTSDEVFALTAFLEDADTHQALQQRRYYGSQLFYSGAAGFVVLMVLFAFYGRRRRKRPVFDHVFARQIRTR